VTLENIGYGFPSGPIGKGAVDKDDGFDGRMRRE
jgi:hypothetical protein